MLTRKEYEAKRQARYDRLMAAAEKADREGAASRQQARQMADVIPFGQPILVGHYSERLDRNYRARIDNKFRKGFELMQKAEEYRNRAAATANNDAIMSDDPDATDKLSDRIAEAEAKQSEMKRINAALRKGADFDTLDMSEWAREELLVIDRVQGYYSPKTKGFPPYMLTNNNANIRRLKERAAIVAKKQSLHDEDITHGDIRIEGRPSENRLRVFYPGRVDLDTYKLLKQHGFRPLRSEGEGAFSAYYNNNSRYFVKVHIMDAKS